MQVAAIGYLNAEPLVRGLPWQVERLTPVQMSLVRLGGFDLVLAPVVIAFESQEWEMLLDAPAIGCCGAVGSVRLEFAPGYTIANATRFAFSTESQTSNRLLQVLLAFYWRRPLHTVEFFSPAQQAKALEAEAPHAWVVIGDRALQESPGSHAIDLGQTWHEWTGLPFVFACWLKHPGIVVDAAELCAVRDRNLATVAEWLPGASRAEHLPYLTKQLVYDFGPKQHQGLACFREYLANLDRYLDHESLLANPLKM